MSVPEFWTLPSRGGDARGQYATCDDTQRHRKRGCQCFVIVTTCSLLWTVLTVLTTLSVVTCVITPQWLLSETRSVGVFNRCNALHGFSEAVAGGSSCVTFVSSRSSTATFPHAWRAALAAFVLAVALLGATCLTALLSLCRRGIAGKSIFTLSGFIQSAAGQPPLSHLTKLVGSTRTMC